MWETSETYTKTWKLFTNQYLFKDSAAIVLNVINILFVFDYTSWEFLQIINLHKDWAMPQSISNNQFNGTMIRNSFNLAF